MQFLLLLWGVFGGTLDPATPKTAPDATGTAAPKTAPDAAAAPPSASIVNIEKISESAGKPGILARHPTLATAGMVTGVPILTTLLGMQMWEWGDTTHFKAGSDGGFERHNTHGGADKLGHAWSFYFGTRLFTAYFDAVYPQNHFRATLWGAALSWSASVAVEIGDGFAPLLLVN